MSTRPSLLPFTWLLAITLCSAGCDDSLKSVSLIEETRVLGARVEVETDASRSSPNVGERASLRFFVVAPDGEPRVSYALSVCGVRLTNSGFPPCASAPFASAALVEPIDADARLDFRVPEEVDLDATPHAFASGLICPDSALNLGSDDVPSCLSGVGTEVAFEFALGGPEQSNHNPTFTEDALSLDGEPWAASAETSCEAGSLPQVAARSLHALRIDLADSDFEHLTQQTSVDPARETMLVSPFSSAGKLGHGFLAIDADTAPEQRRVSWEAPAISGTSSSLVRFYFVVRDARGGQDFAHRTLCVVP
jgi:hypothetical protein